MSFLLKMVRTLFSFIDKAIYSLISLFYELLMYLANLDLFGMSTISTSNTSLTANNPILKFSNRIYALLGIFMLFRISFSILQYMINPDDFSDKGKGFGKLITNVLVSLVLIVTVPLIFQKAYEVQKIVLNENLLGKLILGVNDNGNNSKSTNKQMAKDLEFLVYASLMPVNENAVSECKDSPVLGTKAMAQNDECLNSLSNALGDDSGELNKVFKTDDEGSNRDFGAFGTLLNAVGDDDEFVFEYYVVLTTFAGGFIAVMMVSFCLDVAVRIIKLAFLEIIAPIPVISYMDPSQSSKDGMLSKWAKECFSTFLSLFIRIAIIYFAFYLIDLVVSTCLVSNGTAVYLNEDAPTGLMAILVQVSVIFGILYFTKEFPKLLESIFGIKLSGSLNFDRIKGMGKAVWGFSGAAVGGAIGGGLANAIAGASDLKRVVKENVDSDETYAKNVERINNANHFSAKDRTKALNKAKREAYGRAAFDTAFSSNTAKFIGSVIGGTASGGVRGGVSGFKSKDKDVIKGAHEGKMGAVIARNNRDTRQGAGYGILEQAKDKVNVWAGVKNKTGGVGQMDQEIKQMKRDSENFSLREHATRDAMANMIANSPVSVGTMESFMFETVKDDKGNTVLDPVTGGIIYKKYDDNSVPTVKTWDEIDQDEASRLGITEDFYTKYSTAEYSALSDDAAIEKIRSETKKREDVINLKKEQK